MIKLNNHLTTKLIRQIPVFVQNPIGISSLRRFCEKRKLDEESSSKEEIKTTEEYERNESKKHWYTYLRKLRRFLGVLIKYGFYTYAGLFISNYLIYKKVELVEKNLGVLKMDHFQRVIFMLKMSRQFIVDILTLPYSSKLLPDNIDLIMTQKKTLVVNLNKTLVSVNYKLGTGFEITKRKGLEKFLQELSQHYEIIVFDNMDSMFIEQVCESLDPFKTNIFYKLGKEATRIEKGTYVKDLKFLGRDLNKVIVLDYNPESVKYQPDNLILVPEFNGNDNDLELAYMVHFLIAMSKPTIKDVRKELEKWGHYKPYINFYKSDKKYANLLPKEAQVKDIIDDDYGKDIKRKV